MNPSVAVAFMTKMKLIFETDANGNPQADTFLAFQNGSFPVSKETFYFMEPAKHGLGNNETAQWMMNFDKTFNFVATVDDVITSTPDELDQVYYDTLKSCEPAASSRTPDQEARYAAALAFLQQTVPDNDGQPVLVLDNYQRYENAYREAVSTYKNSKIAAESAQGEGADAIKQDWLDTEPTLQRACDAAQLNWETKGRRSEVEGQLATFIALSGSSPRKAIADMQSDYELFGKATALDPLANEINYLPTQFSPINFYDDDVPWQPLSLDKSEINSLLQQAPAHLKSLFELGGTTDIENLTLEYTVVEIVRNWFHFQDFVLQRFWKLAPGATPLADDAGHGRLPAFPDKLVFVRNVNIVAPQTGQPPAAGPLRLSAQLFAQVQPSALPQLQDKAVRFEQKDQLTQRMLSVFRAQQAQRVAPTEKADDPAGQIRGPWLKRLPLMAAPHAAVMPIRNLQINKLASTGPAVAARPVEALDRSRVLVGTRASSFRVPLTAPIVRDHRTFTEYAPPPVESPAPTGPTLATTSYPAMELLAFICRKLPPCPNPDPNLSWS